MSQNYDEAQLLSWSNSLLKSSNLPSPVPTHDSIKSIWQDNNGISLTALIQVVLGEGDHKLTTNKAINQKIIKQAAHKIGFTNPLSSSGSMTSFLSELKRYHSLRKDLDKKEPSQTTHKPSKRSKRKGSSKNPSSPSTAQFLKKTPPELPPLADTQPPSDYTPSDIPDSIPSDIPDSIPSDKPPSENPLSEKPPSDKPLSDYTPSDSDTTPSDSDTTPSNNTPSHYTPFDYNPSDYNPDYNPSDYFPFTPTDNPPSTPSEYFTFPLSDYPPFTPSDYTHSDNTSYNSEEDDDQNPIPPESTVEGEFEDKKRRGERYEERESRRDAG
jgi:hypothetical protein